MSCQVTEDTIQSYLVWTVEELSIAYIRHGEQNLLALELNYNQDDGGGSPPTMPIAPPENGYIISNQW